MVFMNHSCKVNIDPPELQRHGILGLQFDGARDTADQFPVRKLLNHAEAGVLAAAIDAHHSHWPKSISKALSIQQLAVSPCARKSPILAFCIYTEWPRKLPFRRA